MGAVLLVAAAHPAAAVETIVHSDPPSVDFGIQPVGSSTSQELTLRVNPGLPVGGLARNLVVDVSSIPFALVSNDCQAIQFINGTAGIPTSCRVVVAFRPTEPGEFTGSVTIRYEVDTPRGWVTRSLTVTLRGAAIRCKPGYGHGDKNHCHAGPRART